MISLKCGIQHRTQINLSESQKQTHRHRKWTYGCQGGRGMGEGGLGVWD